MHCPLSISILLSYSNFVSTITPTDNEKEEINKKIYAVHKKADINAPTPEYKDDDGTLINQARVDKAKKELIKLFLKKTNDKEANNNIKILNITDVEMLAMTDLIFDKSATVTVPADLTNLATNVLHILSFFALIVC